MRKGGGHLHRRRACLHKGDFQFNTRVATATPLPRDLSLSGGRAWRPMIPTEAAAIRPKPTAGPTLPPAKDPVDVMTSSGQLCRGNQEPSFSRSQSESEGPASLSPVCKAFQGHSR